MSKPRLPTVFFGVCLALSACGAESVVGQDDGAGNRAVADRGSVVDPVASGRSAEPRATTLAPSSAEAPPTTSAPLTTARLATARRTTSRRTTAAPKTVPPSNGRTSTTGAEADPVESSAPGPTGQPAEQAPVNTGGRNLVAQHGEPMASFDEVTLLHPSNRIERIGFHQSNHDGARQLVPAETAVNPLVLESRDRGTGSRTAADVVVEPGTAIRAPVSGTVLRAGGYILYCEYHDDFVVIEPDAHPGWELKLLHISGVAVGKGDRVEAGVTVLAPAATPLPFDSQVDEFTAEPSWPHVHIELVDPSIPDRPSSGGGC